jgi:hypothetical protein
MPSSGVDIDFSKTLVSWLIYDCILTIAEACVTLLDAGA